MEMDRSEMLWMVRGMIWVCDGFDDDKMDDILEGWLRWWGEIEGFRNRSEDLRRWSREMKRMREMREMKIDRGDRMRWDWFRWENWVMLVVGWWGVVGLWVWLELMIRLVLVSWLFQFDRWWGWFDEDGFELIILEVELWTSKSSGWVIQLVIQYHSHYRHISWQDMLIWCITSLFTVISLELLNLNSTPSILKMIFYLYFFFFFFFTINQSQSSNIQLISTHDQTYHNNLPVIVGLKPSQSTTTHLLNLTHTLSTDLAWSGWCLLKPWYHSISSIHSTTSPSNFGLLDPFLWSSRWRSVEFEFEFGWTPSKTN